MNPWAKMAADNQAMLKKPLKGLKKPTTEDVVYDQVMENSPEDAWWKKEDAPMWQDDNAWGKARKK